MESYEVEIRGKTYRVKPVRNLSGHNIKQYRIHGGKSIPFVKNRDQTKMEEGEVFAIETFGSTGRGYIVDDVSLLLGLTWWGFLTAEQVGVYGYGLNHDAPLRAPVTMTSAKWLHKTIRENFGTIVFCRRYLERLGVEKYLAGVSRLHGHWLKVHILTHRADEPFGPARSCGGVWSSHGCQGVVLGPV
jgi:methionyl aminopeptidase